jgi:hypothetical protein
MKKQQKNTIRSEYNSAISKVTDDLLTSKFTTELGQKARVERSTINSEHMDQLRAVIADVGRDMLEIKAVPKGMQYRGSLCVHVYASEVLRTAAFATTSNMESLTFDLADGALRELTGTTMIQFGKNRQKLRSGF